MRVLVIDDSRTARSIAVRVLNDIGILDTEQAVDGIDALVKAGKYQPQLVLCDWNMPNLDGPGFVKAFRETDQSTPIIMVTTEGEKYRVVQALRLGVNNYVVKPYTPELLRARILETLAARFKKEKETA
jgi:two-component system chemotaxis response regulator CheY